MGGVVWTGRVRKTGPGKRREPGTGFRGLPGRTRRGIESWREVALGTL